MKLGLNPYVELLVIIGRLIDKLLIAAAERKKAEDLGELSSAVMEYKVAAAERDLARQRLEDAFKKR